MMEFQRVARSSGLRTQLLVGLSVILLMAAVSVGLLTRWSATRSGTEIQLEQAKVLARGVAALLAHRTDAREQRRLVAALGQHATLEAIELVDRDQRVSATAGRGAKLGERVTGPDLLQAAALAEPVLHVDQERQQIVASVGVADVGVARLRLPLARRVAVSDLAFWVITLANGLVLLIFVAYVIGRYAVTPLAALEDAARRVAAGDLAVRLDAVGAKEFISLSRSFNQMTLALHTQMAQLEDQRQQLIRSEKLASVGRLAMGVAHEVGNPLQSIIGFTDLLLRGGVEPKTAQDYLGRIHGEAGRIHQIVRELLDYSRPVSEGTEAVSLESVVTQARGLVEHQQRLKKARILCQGLSDLPRVRANDRRLVQVIVNLLLNAADAITSAGTIEIEGTLGADGRTVVLSLSNDGTPIEREDRERIFDPFFTTKAPGEGTGLGLAVGRSIVEAFGGRLVLDLAERTRFVIELPRFEQD
jgi:signal transduction histidine kinase